MWDNKKVIKNLGFSSNRVIQFTVPSYSKKIGQWIFSYPR
jgi:hypothetical protein